MPFDLLRNAAGKPRWAWLHRHSGWIGIGLKHTAEAQGQARFQALKTALETAPAPHPHFVGVGFAARDHRAAPWWQAFPGALLATPAVVEHYHVPLPDAPPAPDAHPQPKVIGGTTFAAWQQAVEAVLEAIRQQRLRKAVLARAEVLQFPAPISSVAVLEALHAQHPHAYCFLMEPTPGTAFVGATPELLARVRAGAVETIALAGSAPRGRDQHEDARMGRDLLSSDKDRREHAVVVEAIRTALTPLTRGLAIPAAPRLRRLPHIQHLETPIRGLLKPGVGLMDVAAALHPTPALGGMPRDEALACIAAHEAFPRGWYAAPVGIAYPDGSGELGVAIRSALVFGNTAVLYAGAGIVAGSDPAREWEETSLKLATMRTALQVAVSAAAPALAS